ncbi:MAG TPA: hypothetical protein PK677_11335 [Acidiphilium sp.]|nr:hypothetical protein [Acidiphilium sp.]
MTEKPILNLDEPGHHIIRMGGKDWAITDVRMQCTIESRIVNSARVPVARKLDIVAMELFPVPPCAEAKQ